MSHRRLLLDSRLLLTGCMLRSLHRFSLLQRTFTRSAIKMAPTRIEVEVDDLKNGTM